MTDQHNNFKDDHRWLNALFLLKFAILRVWANQAPSESYIHNATLKRNEFVLYWKFTDNNITFEVHAKTTGWVGIGVSENANMIAADITVGWVKNGNATITDRHGGTFNGFPEKDVQQDVNLISGQECDGWTILKFSRQLGSCESSGDREITSSTTRVIWAFGKVDPANDDIIASDMHATQDRGSMSLYLLENPQYLSARNLSTGAYSDITLRADRFLMPNERTHYNCILFKLPAERKHVVKVSPVITTGNERFVHHMILYSCGVSIPNDDEIGKNAECYGSNMAYFHSCSTLLAAWAIGGSEYGYSDIAGLPIGGNAGPLYAQLEIHYDNPDGAVGIRDSSGLQLTYTDNLLPNEIGVWQIGNRVGSIMNVIPPKASNYLMVGSCTGTCLSEAMDEVGVTNVTAVAVMLHSHVVGRKMRLRHIRNGEELEPTFDYSYDFNYQEVRLLNPPKIVLPGDQFRMECTYNTTERTVLTQSGLETNDEMCLAFVFYYPRVDVAKCESEPDAAGAGGFFGIEGISGSGNIYSMIVTAPPALENRSVGDVVNSYPWTDVKAEELSQIQISTTQSQVCQKQEKTSSVTSQEETPTIVKEFVIQPRTCLTPEMPYIQTKKEGLCSNSSPSPKHGKISEESYLFVFGFTSIALLLSAYAL